jgi:hypothetical protein
MHLFLAIFYVLSFLIITFQNKVTVVTRTFLGVTCIIQRDE